MDLIIQIVELGNFKTEMNCVALKAYELMLRKAARLRNKRFSLFLSVYLSFLLLQLLLCVFRRVGHVSGANQA